MEDCTKLCRSILQSDSKNVECLQLLAVVRHRSGHAEEAFKLLEKAAKLAPTRFDIRKQCVQVAAELGRHDAALAQLEAMLHHAPNDVALCQDKARLFESCGRLEDAVTYLTALSERFTHNVTIQAHLSALLKQTGRLSEAEAVCRDALKQAPNEAGLHNNLGNILRQAGRQDEAVASYRHAIDRKPDFVLAYSNLGETLFDIGEHGAALDAFDRANTPYSRARALLCLADLEQWSEYDRRLSIYSDREPLNLRMAAISAYCAERRGTDDPYRFCRNPFDHIRIERGPDRSALVKGLLDAIQTRNAVWEPDGQTTTGGFQSSGNLFATPCPSLEKLENLIRHAATAYRKAYSGSDAALIQEWPAAYRLQAWYVELRQGGFQAPHIHPEGWISGVLYLSIPETDADSEDGSIEFILRDETFPEIGDTPHSSVRHKPQTGDLAMFPSSLYHRTVPFDSDSPRICIAFDMLPVQ